MSDAVLYVITGDMNRYPSWYYPDPDFETIFKHFSGGLIAVTKEFFNEELVPVAKAHGYSISVENKGGMK